MTQFTFLMYLSSVGHRQIVDLGVVLPRLVVGVIAARYKGYRYPIEVIGHAVWLHHRFALTLRDVEELMLARGVVVTDETIRSWCAKFGADYANQLRRRRLRPGDKWHLDEVFMFLSRSTALPITCGARSTSTATCSTSWRSRGEGDPFGGPVAMRLGFGGSWSTVERTRLGCDIPPRPWRHQL
jgi:hypothetical protein